ncbi:MAG: hypothetical protein GC164_02470 [Phycisphaera sp.]|nr:hypothetical protein [Phycisphaera sp.]
MIVMIATSLAQLPSINLPPPPMVEHLVLEEPLALTVSLLIVGFVMFLVGRQRGAKGPKRVAGVCALLAVGVYGLGTFVTTQRERVTQITRGLVASTCPVDMTRFRGFFDPGAELVGPTGETWMTFEGMPEKVEETAKRMGIKEQNIRDIQAQVLSDGHAQTLLRVTTKLDESNGLSTLPTTWLLTWEIKTEPGASHGQWRIVTVQWLRMGLNEPPRFGW